MEVKPLTSSLSVSSQIAVSDLEHAAGHFHTIINNRPDNEEPGQPSSAEIETEARRLGLAYKYIPAVSGQLTSDTVQAFAQALCEAEGPVLAFCRTGARSAMLWALSEAPKGNPAEIVKTAAGAGYDLSNLRPHLEQLMRQG